MAYRNGPTSCFDFWSFWRITSYALCKTINGFFILPKKPSPNIQHYDAAEMRILVVLHTTFCVFLKCRLQTGDNGHLGSTVLEFVCCFMEYWSLRLVHFFFVYNVSWAHCCVHEWPVLLLSHYSPVSLALAFVFGHLNISIFSRMMSATCSSPILEDKDQV